MEQENAPEWINKAWESSCRIVLGRSIGGIERYADYLQKSVPKYVLEKSAISGKEVVAGSEYGKGAKFISGEEIAEYGQKMKAAPLNVNDLKDIDSIVAALQENICYAGNIVLGNSSNTMLANRVIGSNFVYKSHDVFYSKYVAHSCIVKYSEYVFGCEGAGKGAHFSIKGSETYECSRVMESVHVYNSADCLFCVNLENCQDCMFSFNLRSKRKCIGNLELAPDKFAALKAKLREEIAVELESKGNLRGIIEIVGG